MDGSSLRNVDGRSLRLIYSVRETTILVDLNIWLRKIEAIRSKRLISASKWNEDIIICAGPVESITETMEEKET